LGVVRPPCVEHLYAADQPAQLEQRQPDNARLADEIETDLLRTANLDAGRGRGKVELPEGVRLG
jgi:hypothetical protein